MERDFKGIWIPKEIWLNEDLTLQEKVFLVEIDSLDNKDGCYASNQYFADFFGITQRRTSAIINSLIEKGYINSTLVYKENSKQILKRVLKISAGGVWNKTSIPYGTKVLYPIEEKFQDNNTINNTINNNKKEKKEKGTEFDFIINSYTENNDLKNTIYDFIKMRKTIKAPLTSNALTLILKKLDNLADNDNLKIDILNQSVMRSWRGIFEIKDIPKTNEIQERIAKGEDPF